MVEKILDEIESHITSDNYDEEELYEVFELLEEHGYVVEETFEEGGRWNNYKTRVFAVEVPHDRTRYFALTEEVPATEMQDGGDFTWSLCEVYATTKTITVYE